MSDTKQDIWKELRKPFPKEVVGQLPKVNCYNCTQATRNAKSAFDKHCDKHSMQKCSVCGAYITEGHIHLDYVGHAAVTDRLLEVDPQWSWQPCGTDDHGSPALDAEGNLWIALTVSGVTRMGVGDGPNMKERIGDALRNAAMRFGVALDLWSKEELESTLADPGLKNEKPSKDTRPAVGTAKAPVDQAATPTQKARIKAYLTGLGIKPSDMPNYLELEYGIIPGSTMTFKDADNIIGELQS